MRFVRSIALNLAGTKGAGEQRERIMLVGGRREKNRLAKVFGEQEKTRGVGFHRGGPTSSTGPRWEGNGWSG